MIAAKTYQSVFEISGIGPVHKSFRFEMPREGCVLVLRGYNGSGKTTVQKAMKAILGGAGERPTRNDQCDSGEIKFGDRSMRISKQTRTTGPSESELGILHVEDSYNIADIVNPAGVKPETRDSVRARALVQLSGVRIPFSQFEALVPKHDGHDPVSIEAARKEEDPVAQADSVKRMLDKEAKRVESLAEKERDEQAAAERDLVGIDLSLPSDRMKLQAAHQKATAAHAKLQEQAKAAAEAAQARAAAVGKLDQTKGAYKGPTVAQAEDDLLNTETSVADAKEKLQEIENEYRKQKAKLAQLETEAELARVKKESAVHHDEMVSNLTGLLEGQLPAPPDPELLEAAEQALEEASEAVEVGVKVRSALEKKALAQKHREIAEKHESYAAKLREAGKSTDDVLNKAIRLPNIKMLGGRVIYFDADKEEMFDRLSDGQRWKVAVEIGALRVSERGGDGTRLLILPQNAWESLDPDNKDIVADCANLEEVVILTAHSDRGPLRLVKHGEEDVDLNCADSEQAV